MICEEHPILGVRRKGSLVGNGKENNTEKNNTVKNNTVKSSTIKIYFEGAELAAEEGEPIAVALLAAGIKDFRITRKRREPRGVYCAIGRCTDCMMVVDGQANVRTCITPATDGMQVERITLPR